MPPGRKPAIWLVVAGLFGSGVAACMREVPRLDVFRFAVAPFCMALSMSVVQDKQEEGEGAEGYEAVRVEERAV